MRKKYTKLSVFGRLFTGIAVAAIIAAMIFNAGLGQEPQDIHAFIDAKGADVLALKDWMKDNGMDSIQMLNKNNRNYGSGLSIQTGRLYAYFDGPGKDMLFNTQSTDDMSEAMGKAFEIASIAEAFGAYEYLQSGDVFEIKISGDAVHRPSGMTGTSVFYTDQPDAKARMGDVQDLGGGWYLASGPSSPQGIRIDFRSGLFWIILIFATFGIVFLVLSLCYKRLEANARVLSKGSEYIGDRPRILNHFKGEYASVFEHYTIYKITFLTEQNQEVRVCVPKLEYERIGVHASGLLKYKRLLNRYKYINFEIYSG